MDEKYIKVHWPNNLEINKRVHNEKKMVEKIYFIEDDITAKYVSTINLFEDRFEKLRTYKVNSEGISLVHEELRKVSVKSLSHLTFKQIQNIENSYKLFIS